jgi:hypothetical protein
MTLEPMHGFGIARIEQISRGVFKVNRDPSSRRFSA